MTDLIPVVFIPNTKDLSSVFSNAAFTAIAPGNGLPFDVRDVSSFFAVTSWAWEATAAPQTLNEGTRQVDILTFQSTANSVAADYIVITDTNGNTWAAALKVSAVDAPPTGTAWTNVAAARRTFVDVTAGLTAAQVATAVKVALNLLGINAVITLDDSAANGTLTLTGIARGVVSVPVPHATNDVGAGTITETASVTGVNTQVALSGTFTSTAHGLFTGQAIKITTNGVAIPAPLVIGTVYYVIKLTNDTFQLASSRANAVLGTPITLTSLGDETKTITLTVQANAGSFIVQYCIDVGIPTVGSTWTAIDTIDLVAKTSPQTDLVVPNPYMWVRGVLAVTSGALHTMNLQMTGKIG